MLCFAESYFHALDPFAVRFPASWPVAGVRWYGLSYAVGFVIAWLILRWFAKTGRSPLSVQGVSDLMFAVILGVLLGGRLGYAIFYEPHLLIDFSSGFPFWGLLAINKGGMASHGGIVGVILACLWFARRHHVPALHLFDMAALGGAPGLGIGRIANFINGELWGRTLPVDMQTNPPWWSVKYPAEVTDVWLEIAQNPAAHSAQVVAGAQAKLDIVKQQLGPILGADTPLFDRVAMIGQNSQAQFHVEVQNALAPLLTPHYPSQIFQAITDGPILIAFLCLLWLRPRKPGVIASWWLIGYGVLRIITEIWRQPDAGVSLTLGVLSRGQTLSVLMILAGGVMLVMSMHSKWPRMGGLLRSAKRQIEQKGVRPMTGS